MDSILVFLRLETLVTLSGAVGLITQLIKRMPQEWTSSNAKIIVWIVSAIIVGGIGIYQKESPETMLLTVPIIALVAHGLYDVVTGIWRNLK